MSPDHAHDGEDSRLAQDRAWVRWALSRWESFPVGRDPRPLVMTAPLTRFERGFRTGEAKLAFHYGDVEAAVPLPESVLGLLRDESPPLPEPTERRWSNPLLISEASSGRTTFETDRGRREFPAWRLGGPDIDGHFWVLDPAIAATRWMPPEPAPPRPFQGQPHRSRSAVIGPDERSLRYTFIGGAPKLFEYPAAEVIETDQAVAVLSVSRYVGRPGPVAAVGVSRSVTATLARPLGRRVLVDLDASPVTVLPAEQGASAAAELSLRRAGSPGQS